MALAGKPGVDEPLRELEAEEVKRKGKTSEWAAPIVTPVKNDGSVRTCLASRLPLIARIDDIYASLGWGILLSVLEIRHAYLQMEVPCHFSLSTPIVASTSTNVYLTGWLLHQPCGPSGPSLSGLTGSFLLCR